MLLSWGLADKVQQYKLLEYISLVVDAKSGRTPKKVHKSLPKNTEAVPTMVENFPKTVYGLEKINKNGIH